MHQAKDHINKKLLTNHDVGIVCDAEHLISDPGYKLDRIYFHKITHAPGPSSVINGLILSGLPTNQFYFGGLFLQKQFKENSFTTETIR